MIFGPALASKVCFQGPVFKIPIYQGAAPEIQLPGEAEDVGPRTTPEVALPWRRGSGQHLQEDFRDNVAVPLPLGLLFQRSLQRGSGEGQGIFASGHFPQPRL